MLLGAVEALGIHSSRPSPRAFTVTLKVDTPMGKRDAWTLVDSGVQEEFANQRWAKQHLPPSEALPRSVSALNGHKITYDQRNIIAYIVDAKGAPSISQLRQLTCTVITLYWDTDGYELTL